MVSFAFRSRAITAIPRDTGDLIYTYKFPWRLNGHSSAASK